MFYSFSYVSEAFWNLSCVFHTPKGIRLLAASKHTNVLKLFSPEFMVE